MTKALKGLELMLPAHVSPAKQYRTGMNGSKDNTSRLKWLLRGLHSVFGTQMDHPFGPLICFTDTYTQTHCKAHTHRVWLIQHGDPLLSAPRQLCLHGSSGKSICCYREPWKGSVKKRLQMLILTFSSKQKEASSEPEKVHMVWNS